MFTTRPCASLWPGVCRALAVCLLGSAQPALADDTDGAIRLSEPVEVTETHETFGTAMPESVDAVALSTLVSNHEDYVGKSVAITARVSQVCRKKGCFFIAQDGATTVRVSFKDYGFFVPTDIAGRHITLIGELTQRDVTLEQAQHYAEDLGTDDADMAAGPRFEIVATAVRIPVI